MVAEAQEVLVTVGAYQVGKRLGFLQWQIDAVRSCADGEMKRVSCIDEKLTKDIVRIPTVGLYLAGDLGDGEGLSLKDRAEDT